LSGVAENRTLTAVPGITVGHAQHGAGETGCTVAIGPFVAAVEVRGLATGSRELDALSPLHLVPRCDAILLTGGSAFGLAAADGVSRWLEERGRGYETRAAVVPIVPAAVIYDLGMGDASARPDPEMGYAAAAAASERSVEEGRVGVGAGASVGKLRPEGLEPAGVGSWSEDHGEHYVEVIRLMPGMTSVELLGQGPDSVTIRTNEGLMKRTNISKRVGADAVVVEFDEEYEAGSMVTATSHCAAGFQRCLGAGSDLDCREAFRCDGNISDWRLPRLLCSGQCRPGVATEKLPSKSFSDSKRTVTPAR